MLILKRITHFNEFLKCKASGQILMYGDFYYTDTEDPSMVIDAKYYHNQKMERKKENWPYSEILEKHESLKEYQDDLQEKEQEYLTSVMLDKYHVFGHDAENYQRDEDNGVL